MKHFKRIALLLLTLILLVTLIPSPEALAAKKSKKPYLSTRFKCIEKKTDQLYDNAWTQYDMNMASAEEVSIWKKEIKKVYKKELNRISKKKVKQLKKEQKKWEKGMTAYAEKEASDCEGGSMYPLIYNLAQSSYIKKRIKKIIKKYGDIGNF